jgi:hypothetical protein
MPALDRSRPARNAEIHGPVGWTEISGHPTQDEATAAWRTSR